MDSAPVDPHLTLILALITLLGLSVPPIIVALINRGGKAKPLDLTQLPPDIVMPRRQYDELVDQYGRADDENERLGRECQHLRSEIADLRAEVERLTRRKGGHA